MVVLKFDGLTGDSLCDSHGVRRHYYLSTISARHSIGTHVYTLLSTSLIIPDVQRATSSGCVLVLWSADSYA